MKKQLIALQTILYASFFPMLCYAEGMDGKKMNIVMLTAIGQIAQTASWLIFVFAIGLLILSYKDNSGPMRSNSLKLFGIFFAGQALLPLLRSVGLAY